jgi:hypothetical protein
MESEEEGAEACFELILRRSSLVAGGSLPERGNTFWINQKYTDEHPTFLFLACSCQIEPAVVLALSLRGAKPDEHVLLDAQDQQHDVTVISKKGLRMCPAIWAAVYKKGCVCSQPSWKRAHTGMP